MRFLHLLAFLFLVGCTFAKDGGADRTFSEELTNYSNPKLNSHQIEILNAIKSRNVSYLDDLLSKLDVSDLSFGKTVETPMAVAITNNDFDSTKLLIEKSVDIFNFGQRQNDIEKLILGFSQKTVVAENKLSEEVQDREDFSAAALVGANSLDIFKRVLSNSQNVSQELRKLRMLGLTCTAFEKYIILSMQTIDSSPVVQLQVLKYLESLNCPYEGGDRFIQKAYETELLLRTRDKFKNTSLLSYLSHHRALLNVMIEVVPGLFLGPTLLYRVSQSPEAGVGDLNDIEDLRAAKEFISGQKIAASKYEFLQIVNGQIAMAFLIFPRQPEMNESPLDEMYEAIYKFAVGSDRNLISSLLTRGYWLQAKTRYSLPYHPSMARDHSYDVLSDRQRMFIEREQMRMSPEDFVFPYPMDEQLEKPTEKFVPEERLPGGTGPLVDLPNPFETNAESESTEMWIPE